MSDARDAVAEALALNRRLAATLLVKKQELEAQLAAGPSTERAAVVAAELADVEAQYRSALAEINELRKLGDQALVNETRAVAADALPGNPVATSYEDRALAAAREHILELDAQAGLGAEGPARPGAQRSEEPRGGRTRGAREEFEALRARRTGEPAAEPGRSRGPRRRSNLRVEGQDATRDHGPPLQQALVGQDAADLEVELVRVRPGQEHRCLAPEDAPALIRDSSPSMRHRRASAPRYSPRPRAISVRMRASLTRTNHRAARSPPAGALRRSPQSSRHWRRPVPAREPAEAAETESRPASARDGRRWASTG